MISSRGSHGPADIVAIKSAICGHPHASEVLLIQCKSVKKAGKAIMAEFKELEKLAFKLNAVAVPITKTQTIGTHKITIGEN